MGRLPTTECTYVPTYLGCSPKGSQLFEVCADVCAGWTALSK